MKLEYEMVEENYDDTTKIRTMTEQAIVEGGGIVLRTTAYSQHHLSVNVVFIPGIAEYEPLVR